MLNHEDPCAGLCNNPVENWFCHCQYNSTYLCTIEPFFKMGNNLTQAESHKIELLHRILKTFQNPWSCQALTTGGTWPFSQAYFHVPACSWVSWSLTDPALESWCLEEFVGPPPAPVPPTVISLSFCLLFVLFHQQSSVLFLCSSMWRALNILCCKKSSFYFLIKIEINDFYN